MTNQDLCEIILNNLGWSPTDIAKKKHGKSNEWTNKKFIELILEYESGPAIKIAENCGLQTFYRVVDKLLVPIFGKLNGGNETWKYKLLELIEYKECSCCHKVLSYTEFHNSKDTSSGKVTYCKSCRIKKSAEYYKTDSGQEAHAKYYSENYPKFLARNSVYKSERSLRVPAWSETDKISEFYKNCPTGMHVDHILPLKGDTVSGLHVLGNLQYLTPEQNLAKGNKFYIT